MPSPIDTIMAAISPVPRRRSGAQSQASFAQPNNPQRTKAIAAAGKNCRPPKSGRNGRLPVLIHQVSSAPRVTSSPWAKLVSPVVPKISDSPTAASAMINPNRKPSAISWAAWLHLLSTTRVLLPSGNSTGLSWSTRTGTFSDFLLSSVRFTPFGRALVSMLTV